MACFTQLTHLLPTNNHRSVFSKKLHIYLHQLVLPRKLSARWRKFETSPEVSGEGFHSRGRGEKETTKRQKKTTRQKAKRQKDKRERDDTIPACTDFMLTKFNKWCIF